MGISVYVFEHMGIVYCEVKYTNEQRMECMEKQNYDLQPLK